MLERFRDPDGGVLYSASADHRDILFRPKDWDDNAVPAGNSLAAETLIELSLLSGEGSYRDAALDLISALTHALGSHPLFFGRLLAALDTHLSNPLEVAVGRSTSTPEPAPRPCFGRYTPSTCRPRSWPPGRRVRRYPNCSKTATPPGGSVAAYVCRGFVCSLPVTSPAALREQLGLPTPAPEGFQAVWRYFRESAGGRLRQIPDARCGGGRYPRAAGASPGLVEGARSQPVAAVRAPGGIGSPHDFCGGGEVDDGALRGSPPPPASGRLRRRWPGPRGWPGPGRARPPPSCPGLWGVTP